MTKQDRNILFMAILTLALIVAAGVRVLFGAVAADAPSPQSSPLKGEDVRGTGEGKISLGVGANLPADVLSAIRNWPKGLSAKEMAIFSEGWLALILKPVRSLDMAFFLSPLSQAGAFAARLWRTARAQVWGWIQSVKKSLARLPSHLFLPSPSPSSSPLKGEERLGGVSLHKFCILRL